MDSKLSGVQCESCHGLGALYAPEFVMRDPKLRELLGLKKVDEGTCRACHQGVSPSTRPFDYATWVLRVNHSKKRKEAQ